MTPNVTKEDLLKLQIKLTEAAKDDRHKLKNLISENAFSLDEYKTDQALIKQSHKTMQDNIKEMKKEIKEGFDKIENLFLHLPEQFATKQEHKENTRKIEAIHMVAKWFI